MNVEMPSYQQSANWNFSALLWSIALHVAIVLALVAKVDWHASDDFHVAAKVIDAVIVDSNVLDAAKKKAENELLREQQKEQQRLKQAQEREQALRLQKQRQIQEQKHIAEQKRIAKEKQLAEQKRQADEMRRAEERELLEQMQREEYEALQAEEEEADAAQQAKTRELAGLRKVYEQAIKQRINRHWVRPASAEDWYRCEVIVDQIPGGEVVNVKLLKCDGDALFQHSIRNAVYKSSPLPEPPIPEVFDRNLQLTFKVPSE